MRRVDASTTTDQQHEATRHAGIKLRLSPMLIFTSLLLAVTKVSSLCVYLTFCCMQPVCRENACVRVCWFLLHACHDHFLFVSFLVDTYATSAIMQKFYDLWKVSSPTGRFVSPGLNLANYLLGIVVLEICFIHIQSLLRKLQKLKIRYNFDQNT